MRWQQLPSGRVTHSLEPAIIALALLVIPTVLVEESASGGKWMTAAAATNWLIWVGFTAELAFVLAVAPRRRAATRAHWLDIAIVVLTVPLLPGLLAFLRLARLLRLVRLMRLAALGARALAAERVLTSRQTFRYVALATALLVLVAGVAVSYADEEEFATPWLGIWWAITTVTTVGYGDVVPHTVGGRIVAAALMLIGIGFLSMLTAAIASTFVAHDAAEGDKRDDELLATLRRIEERLARLEATRQ